MAPGVIHSSSGGGPALSKRHSDSEIDVLGRDGEWGREIARNVFMKTDRTDASLQ